MSVAKAWITSYINQKYITSNGTQHKKLCTDNRPFSIAIFQYQQITFFSPFCSLFGTKIFAQKAAKAFFFSFSLFLFVCVHVCVCENVKAFQEDLIFFLIYVGATWNPCFNLCLWLYKRKYIFIVFGISMTTLSQALKASKCNPTEFKEPNVGGVIVNHQNSLIESIDLNF